MRTDAAAPSAVRDAGAPSDVDATASEPPDATADAARTCTLGADGTRTGRCRRQNRSCSSWGLALTDYTYNGCADEIGFGGKPEITVSTCAEAIGGASGESCGAELHCVARASNDPCCVDRAECHPDSTLLAARLCVPDCGAKESLPGPVIRSCAELFAAADVEDATGKWFAWGVGVIGRQCTGNFICGGGAEGSEVGGRFVGSYGHYVFCGEGRIQLITEGPGLLYEADGHPYPGE